MAFCPFPLCPTGAKGQNLPRRGKRAKRVASAELRASNEASLTAAVLVAYGGSVSDKRKADCGSLLPGNQRTRKSDVSAVCARVGRRTRCQHTHLSSGLTAASREIAVLSARLEDADAFVRQSAVQALPQTRASCDERAVRHCGSHCCPPGSRASARQTAPWIEPPGTPKAGADPLAARSRTRDLGHVC